MTRVIFFALILAATAQQTPQEELPADVFNHSSRDLVFHVPAGFELVTQKRGYVNIGGQKTPRFQRIWQHNSDGIIVNIGVWPKAGKQDSGSKLTISTASQMFPTWTAELRVQSPCLHGEL